MPIEEPLFAAYPELRARIDALCNGRAWGLTGASALVEHRGRWLLEVTKPRHWRRRADGRLVVGLGAPGGSLEPGETSLSCLQRELAEELGTQAVVESTDDSYLVYEGRVQPALRLPPRAHPRPALCTISRNLYRRRRLPQYEILVIATYPARLEEPPQLGDLYGLLWLPPEALPLALRGDATVGAVSRLQGAAWCTRRPLAADALIAPVWTARSWSQLLAAGAAGIHWPHQRPTEDSQ